MRALLILPILAFLILAAHFLRGGAMLPVLLCLAACPLCLVRTPAVRRTLQVCLGLGALLWVLRLIELPAARNAAGAPWIRMALILGGVACFTAASAFALEGAQRRPTT